MKHKTPRTLSSFISFSCHRAGFVAALLVVSLFSVSPNVMGSVNDLSYYDTKGNWTLGEGYIEGSDVGSFLFLAQDFGARDFDIRMRLSLTGMSRDARGTAASVQLGNNNHFGFEAQGQLFLEGMIFGSARAQFLRPHAGLFAEGEAFDFRILRENDKLSFFINAELIDEREVRENLGRIGLRPHRGTFRIYEILVDAEPTGRKLSPEELKERVAVLGELEASIDAFLKEPAMEIQTLFGGQRFPNVVVALDGSVTTTWGGWQNVHSRRSPDGGKTWEPPVMIRNGGSGGGLTVDEVTGDLLTWIDSNHPPSETHLFRSSDQGKTWSEAAAPTIYPLHRKASGVVPSMHMNESGITLRHGPHKGRLIRTTGNYMGGNIPGGPADAFANAIYSDDGGSTWDTSAPFPAFGTNEAAIAELSDGSLIFITRRHLATDGRSEHHKHIARSYDGGETWREHTVSSVPDGNTNSRYGLMHGLTRLPVKGKDILLLSCIESDVRRERGTIWMSFDGGQTWPLKRLVHDGLFAYSSIDAGRPGTPSEGWIYLLFEPKGQLMRFNLSWLLQDAVATGDGTAPDWLASSVPGK